VLLMPEFTLSLLEGLAPSTAHGPTESLLLLTLNLFARCEEFLFGLCALGDLCVERLVLGLDLWLRLHRAVLLFNLGNALKRKGVLLSPDPVGTKPVLSRVEGNLNRTCLQT
jgi:hypothetical protein